MSDSIWNDPRITAYVLDELPAEERQAFEAEIEANPELATAVAEARNVTGQLEGMFAAETTPPLDQQRRHVIFSPAPKRPWVIPMIGLATAASLVFLFVMPPMQQARKADYKISQRNDDKLVAREQEVIATADEFADYGANSAKGAAMEGLRQVPSRAPRTEYPVPSTQNSVFSTEYAAAPSIKSGVRDRLKAKTSAPPAQTVAGLKIAGDTPVPDAGYQLRGPASEQTSLPRLAQPEPESDADSFGMGPGLSGDQFDPITENPFKRVAEHPISTFSVDVDTASYSKTRDFLMRANQLPPAGAVRIEEMINYFDYDYQPPAADDSHPFTTHTVVTSCPWNDERRLARIALKGKVIQRNDRPQCNLVFLLDTSGSMNAANKLPLVVDGMTMLLDQLDKNDKVAITVYAGSAGLVLDSTPAKKKKKIRNALTQLAAGGSTNGGAGIALAYQTARDNFVKDGVNRVILCTDGDFNVGTTSTDSLVRLVEQEAKGGIFLSVLGFGMGNHNDSMLEQISGRGNGNYAFIDNQNEAQKVLVDQTNATLVTIAKDVKLQIEFNPLKVSSYRLIGYENRVLAKEDFNDDNKDAREIGAGHSVTALYEIVPAGIAADESRPKVDDLKYQSEPKPTSAADSDEMLTLKLRYKAPEEETSTLIEFPVTDHGDDFAGADKDVRFAAAVAGFGMQLRRSEFQGNWTLSDVLAVAQKSTGEDEKGLRSEFVELVKKASLLIEQQ